MYTAAPHNAVVSTDSAGMLELWDSATLTLPHNVTFKFKSDTGLYDLAKAKTFGKSIEVCASLVAIAPMLLLLLLLMTLIHRA
jgi:hypothetical protein